MKKNLTSRTDLTKTSQIILQSESLFKKAQKNYEAGYMDYDANSKAYILGHALSSIETAIKLLAPYSDFPIAQKLKDDCNRLKESICKEIPDL